MNSTSLHKSRGRKKREEPSNKEKETKHEIDSEDEPSFTNWLRTGEGVELMKLFVICNSFLVFLTMAWPYMRDGFNAVFATYPVEPIKLEFPKVNQCVIFLFVMLWYSFKMWAAIDEYFSNQFKEYLQDEYRKNKYMNPKLIDQLAEEREENDVCYAF